MKWFQQCFGATRCETVAFLTMGGHQSINLGDYFFIPSDRTDMSGNCELRLEQNGNSIGNVKFTTATQTICDTVTYLGDTRIFYTTKGVVESVRFESFSSVDITKGVLVYVRMRGLPAVTYHVVFK